MIGNYNYGTGRRKSAVARVFIKVGSGKSLSTARMHRIIFLARRV